MREPIRDKDRLNHMAEAADRLLAFASGKVSGDLHQDEMQYFGVVKNLEIIGEAAYMLTKQFREEHSEVPWKKVIGMRHYMVHGYYEVDDNVIWDVLKNDLPVLRQQVVLF